MFRRSISLATAAGFTLASAIALAPSAIAAGTVTTTTTGFDVTCRAVPSKFAGAQTQTASASVTVTAPSTVSPGEVFTVAIDPGTVTVPNSTSGAALQKVNRVKIDLAVPENAEVVGHEVTSAGSFGAAATPTVTRVDDAGDPNPNGTVLRLSGDNQTIANGPSTSTSSRGGMTANPLAGDTSVLAFPTVRLTLRAGDSGTITPRVRTAGAAGTFGSGESFLTFLPEVRHGLVGTIWAPTYCQPRDTAEAPVNAGAGALATITIGDTGPVDPGDPDVPAELTATLEGPTTVRAGEKASFAVRPSDPATRGTVRFYADDRPVGDPRPVADGVARLDLTFHKAGTKKVHAVLTAEDGTTATTAPISLTVTGDDGGGSDPTPGDPEPGGGTGSLGSLDLSTLFSSLFSPLSAR